MKARRHEMYTFETPEASKGQGAKEHVEFEPAREHAKHKAREVKQHLRHVRREHIWHGTRNAKST